MGIYVHEYGMYHLMEIGRKQFLYIGSIFV